jgi:hypothetical protein
MLRFRIGFLNFNVVDLIYILSSVLVSLYCLFQQQFYCEWLILLPLTFLVCFILFLFYSCKKTLTAKILTFCIFLRYVFLSLLQNMNPVYNFSSYSINDYKILTKAIFVMSYELLVVSVFIFIYTYINKNKINKYFNIRKEKKFPINKNKYYFIFIFSIFAILLGLVNSRVLKQISFIFIKANTTKRLGQILANSNSIDMIMRQIFLIGVLSLFVIVVVYMQQKYYNKNPRKVLYFAMLGALICISMIIAEQRSSQIYCAFASIILLIQLFPKNKKIIIKIIFSGAIIIVGILTIYKTFYAFRYDSYLDAIMYSDSNFKDFIRTMEIYLLGPITVSSVIKYENIYGGISLMQLFFDIGRSTIGISFLLKTIDYTLTSSSYNLFITSGRSVSGYLLPITGQGYLSFGFILSPLLLCCYLYIAFKLEKQMISNKSAYVVFFASYVFIRLSTCIVSANLSTVMNVTSSIFISAGILYLIQKTLNKILKKKGI